MATDKNEPPSRRGAFVAWLAAINNQLSHWAASLSWGRLILLIIVVLAAGSIVSDQLHLKHDRIRVKRNQDQVQVTISDKDGIRISRGRPPGSAASGPAQQGGAPVQGAQEGNPPGIVIDTDDEDLAELKGLLSQQIFTVRGLIGDLGAMLLTVAFAYLVGAKIVMRKVAQADAKVRTAEHAAEHEAMERQLVQARLQVLQAQVEPHFLFNTLAAIDYLIETDPPRASQMQKALITYLRGALPQMRQESSTLGRELRLIRSYLDLIKMRMEDRLVVDFNVPEGAQTAEFPPMMLQSLVENSIKHGIEPKPEGGRVSVSARIQNGQLWVEVKDTGVGIVDTDRLESPTSGSGLGLQNIRERLAMLFPGKSRLVLVSDESLGTSVKIVVPYQVGPEVAADLGEYGQEKPA
ncbi:hypothetical protein GCM10027034_05960 [Ramlibacter solisilvae]|uniref:histidine kinase n=1 Tax=Ramlibacter tataouinensis TaxID=94132 RepID=UPI0007771955|nr:histidine kinase [Ramlibacter tataouinensis]